MTNRSRPPSSIFLPLFVPQKPEEHDPSCADTIFIVIIFFTPEIKSENVRSESEMIPE